MGSTVISERKGEKNPASIGRKCINNHVTSPGPINMEPPRRLTGLYFTLLRLAALGSINSNPAFPLSQHRCLYLLCWHLHVCVFFLPGLNIQYPCCSLSASQWCHIPAVKAHTIAWLWDYTARNWSCVFIRGRKMGLLIDSVGQPNLRWIVAAAHTFMNSIWAEGFYSCQGNKPAYSMKPLSGDTQISRAVRAEE